MPNPIHFNPIEVPLHGTNLVEASAGTGKTYSVAILVLRLLLEKGLPLKEVLMVTFTNAAVAELEERIRHFVRQAHRYACENDSTIDEGIRKTVDNAIKESRTKCHLQEDLRRAVLLLDETSILTIHSFCQQTLRECAFETGQLFGAELIEDDSAIMEEAVNQFWRKQVTTLPLDLLKLVTEAGVRKKAICELLEKHLSGKSFASYTSTSTYDCTEAKTRDWLHEIKTLVEEEKTILDNLIVSVESNWDNIKMICDADKGGKSLGEKVGDIGKFLKHIKQYGTSKFIQKNFLSYKTDIDRCKDLQQATDNKVDEIVQYLCCSMIQYCSEVITDHKRVKSQISFDDLIEQLYNAICEKKDEALLAILRNKYKAVFVDEFQDTDWQQYKIFKKAFQDATPDEGQQSPIVFYIGDPKQSIYGFRKADLDVYFGAGVEPGVVCHTMNVNHRSTPSLVQAMNGFFAIENPFQDNRLLYQEVLASQRKKDCFFRGNTLEKPLTVFKLQHEADSAAAAARQVWLLLKPDEYSYFTEGQREAVKHSDIGILVRKKREAKAVKLALAKLCIPAITIDETKLLETDEARYLLYWLQACLDPQAGNINRALLSPFTSFTADCLLQRNEDEDSRLFRGYQHLLHNKGIYKALMKFVSDYDVRDVAATAVNGDRTLANLLQLAELLHEVQMEKKYTPSELVCWLQRGMESGEHRGEQFQQRLESDEQAVKIVTIHKSKGLEYKIVLAPFLDLEAKVSSSRPFVSFKENDRYVVVDRKKLTSEQTALYLQEQQRENSRLIYVAITRAVHKCFLFKTHDENNIPLDSALYPFFNDCEARGEGLIELLELPSIEVKRLKPTNKKEKKESVRQVDFQLSQQGWCKLSFTYLAAKGHAAGSKNQDDCGEGYDDFIFKQLRKGEKTGLMLHSIFEHIDFSDSSTWMPVISDTLHRYLPAVGENFKKHLYTLVENVIETPVQCNGESVLLRNVNKTHRLNEFEFDFNVNRFDLTDLSAVLDEQEVKFKYENTKGLEGVMYGLMDLFFIHKSKFYILDWKSNHLGYTVGDYHEGAVVNAMRENNYHLQYLLYTLAAKKYLESRLGNAFKYDEHFGGVIYLFVRGVRKEQRTGVFCNKPSAVLLEKMEDLLSERGRPFIAKNEQMSKIQESVL